jgi:hypothetical protein
MPAGSYSWVNFVTARQQLAQRLADPNMLFWSDNELGIYVQQALRMYNVLTACWKKDYVFNNGTLWNNLGLLPNSPRLRTLTDTYAYTQMEAMLLEPMSGSVWTGTTQFSIQDLSQALQRRRDELLLVSNCNQSLMPGIRLTPNTRRTVLPDTTLEVARVRYCPVGPTSGGYGQGGYGQGGYGGGGGMTYNVTLYRDDVVAQEFYEAGFWQAQENIPQTFMLSSEPPLSWDVDIPPTVPGTYEAVVLQSGAPFNPPATTLLGIPDDFAWALEWGALADLLGRESEATDYERAAYALRRYQDGLNLLIKTPWIMLGKVDGQAVSIDSIEESDRYQPEWDSNPTGFGPVIVAGGVDFFASPVGHSTGLTVLANAPVPILDSDFVQVSRSAWDTVLDISQSLCLFKMGGQEWKAGLELEARAIQFCAAENARLKSSGSFSDIILQRGQSQDRSQERYSSGRQNNEGKGQTLLG